MKTTTGRPYKASTEQYRTIRGERYICWCSDSTPDQIRAYRQSGIKCVRRGVELYLRKEDEGKALAIDRFLSQTPVVFP
jgi:hypothetical protein